MATKGSTIKILAVVAVISVTAYLGFSYFKNKEKKNPSLPDEPILDAPITNNSQSPNASADRPDDVLAFQQWVINVKNDKTILGKGGPSNFGDDGKWGQKTQNAWNKYKVDYNKYLNPEPSYTPPESIANDILTIVAMGSGPKSKKSYLEQELNVKAKRDYIAAWAKALRANKADNSKGTTFVFNTGGKDNGLFEAYSGNKILNFNPNGRNPAPLAKAYWYAEPKVSNMSYVGASGSKIGKIGGYMWNNQTKKLWLWVPKPNDSSVSDANLFGLRWIQANEVKF